jgi:hypothetical protein
MLQLKLFFFSSIPYLSTLFVNILASSLVMLFLKLILALAGMLAATAYSALQD